jgi:hypothetical protein
MIECIIFFVLGFFGARFFQPPLRGDMLLYWDSSSFGWRPVPNAKEINTHSRYVVAIEIDPEAYLKSIEAQEQDKK